jgi:DNA repair protein RAD16
MSAKDCAVAGCRHVFHKECIQEYMEENSGGGGDKAAAAEKPTKKRKPAKAEEAPVCGCPICFLPLTLTLDIRGAGDSESDSDTDGKASTPSAGKHPKQAKTVPLAAKAAAAAAAMGDVGEPDSVARRQAECRACCERPRDACYLPCGHIVLCMECTSKLQSKTCPLCRNKISRVVKAKQGPEEQDSATPADAVTVGRRTILQKLNMSKWQSSSKVEAVALAIDKMVRSDPTGKAIIFSQYRTMIDLVEWRLRNAGIEVVKLLGDLPLAERRSVLGAFKTSPSIKVILMSLKAGGEGLNLQVPSSLSP